MTPPAAVAGEIPVRPAVLSAMGDDLSRFKGDNVTAPARLSPYGASRLAPAIDIVDTAKQIAEADRVIGTVVNAKLEVIAEQIRNLQEQARVVLQQALEDP